MVLRNLPYMVIKPLNNRPCQYLKDHHLVNKFQKQAIIFQSNPKHPSLHTEILEPKIRKIYSFRID